MHSARLRHFKAAFAGQRSGALPLLRRGVGAMGVASTAIVAPRGNCRAAPPQWFLSSRRRYVRESAPNTSFQRTSGLACGQPCRR